MAGVTLDTGALIAAGRNDRVFWTWWKLLTRSGVVATVPAGVVAEACRGLRDARMAQVLAGCRCVPLDLVAARRTGEICARSKTSDVIDASVVVTAAERSEDILTSDPADIEKLSRHAPGVGRIVAIADLREPR